MVRRYIFIAWFAIFAVLLAACSRNGTSTANTSFIGPKQTLVTLVDYKISATTTSFTAGKPYQFVVTNNGNTSHEFMVMAPMNMSMGDMPMGQMDKMAYTYIEAINPGETKSVTYTFPSSTTGKSIEFSCHYPGHYEAGMKLPITVDKQADSQQAQVASATNATTATPSLLPSLQVRLDDPIFIGDFFGSLLSLPVILFLIFWVSEVKNKWAAIIGGLTGVLVGFLLILGWVGTLIYDTPLQHTDGVATFFGSLLLSATIGLAAGLLTDVLVARRNTRRRWAS